MELRAALKEMDAQKKFAKRKDWKDKHLYLICSSETHELNYVVGIMDYQIKDEDEQSQLFVPTEEELAANDYDLISY